MEAVLGVDGGALPPPPLAELPPQPDVSTKIERAKIVGRLNNAADTFDFARRTSGTVQSPNTSGGLIGLGERGRGGGISLHDLTHWCVRIDYRMRRSKAMRGARNVSLVNVERIAKGLKTSLPGLFEWL